VARWLGAAARIDRVARSGLGLAELVHLAVLLVCRGLLRRERAYRMARYAYFSAYLAEDLLPTGRVGYHLAVRAVTR
jgi:hypothetical protein